MPKKGKGGAGRPVPLGLEDELPIVLPQRDEQREASGSGGTSSGDAALTVPPPVSRSRRAGTPTPSARRRGGSLFSSPHSYSLRSSSPVPVALRGAPSSSSESGEDGPSSSNSRPEENANLLELLTPQREDDNSSDEDNAWEPPSQAVGRGVNDLRVERSVTPSSVRSGATTTRSQHTAVSERSNATSATTTTRRRREVSRLEALSAAAEPHPYGLHPRRSVTPLRASQSQSSSQGSSIRVLNGNLVTSNSQGTIQHANMGAATNASVANNATTTNGGGSLLRRGLNGQEHPFSSDSENSDAEDTDRAGVPSKRSIFQRIWHFTKSILSTCCSIMYMSLMWVYSFGKGCLSSRKGGRTAPSGTSNEQRVNGHAHTTHQQANEHHARGDQSRSYGSLSSVLEYFGSFVVFRGRREAGEEVLISHQQTETIHGNREEVEQGSLVSRVRSAVRSWGIISEETKRSFWKLCKLLLCLLLVIFVLYLLWANGDSTRTCLAFLKSCAVGALHIIQSVLTGATGELVAVPFALVAKLRAASVSVPVTPEPPSTATNAELEGTIQNLKLKIEHIEQKLQEYEKKLSKNDGDISTLETEIYQVNTAMKAVSMKQKPIEQILEEVLSASIGEKSDGTPVTLKSMFDLFKKNKGEREWILREINSKFAFVSEHIADVEKESRGTQADFDNMKKELSGLNSRLHLMKSEVEEQRRDTKEPEVDTNQLIEALLLVLKSEIEQKVAISCESRNCPDQSVSSIIGLGASDIEMMIKRAIAKYDADKTGLPDLALEPAGGSILSIRTTKGCATGNGFLCRWGFPLWSPPNTPRTIIQPGVVPGECWAFEGSVGDVVIKLALPSLVTGFTLEHIPKNLSRYNIDSAAKNFQVLGLQSEHDTIEVHDYGTFSYEDNDEPLQYFPVANRTSKFYPIVELKILSNHGNLKYTCIYRFRVHGSIDTERSPGGGNSVNQNAMDNEEDE